MDSKTRVIEASTMLCTPVAGLMLNSSPLNVITAIVAAARRAGRFEILVDAKKIATLSLEAIERLELSVGRDVTGLEDRIAIEAQRLAVYDRSLNMLAFRARSSQELARSLVKKGEDARHVEFAISRLTEQGVLDDARFAESFARAKVLGAKQSRRRVQQGLARKGVGREISEAAIANVFEAEGVDQREIVIEAARKKMRSLIRLERDVQKRRLYAFLARRGYDSDDIRAAMAAVRTLPDE